MPLLGFEWHCAGGGLMGTDPGVDHRPPHLFAGLKFWTAGMVPAEPLSAPPKCWRPRSAAPSAERVEVRLELRRKRTADVDGLAGERVSERKPRGVQELAAQRRVRGTVDGIADDRQADRREMNTDLVRPARLETDTKQRVIGPESLHLELRRRRARRLRALRRHEEAGAGRG